MILHIYKSGIRIGVQIYFFTDIVIFWCKFGIWHPLVRNALWPFYAKIAFFIYFFFYSFSGAFIIPFLVMMVLEGMPLLLLELGIGQKMRTGSFGVWNRVNPLLGGIGLGSTVVAMIVGCYYNVIIAWCLFYLYNSLSVGTMKIIYTYSCLKKFERNCFKNAYVL